MEAALPAKPRIYSIDILRGIIMLIMALDHVRDYFSNVNYDPLDLTKASVLLFFTRWITHFCAPTFVFLSGTSAFLSLSKRKTKGEAALFLLSRGAWLLVLESTVISFGWQFDPGFHMIFAQVIWAIGWSMIVLSGLIYFKPLYVGLIGLVLIFGHNAFDQVHASQFQNERILWSFLHEQGFYPLTQHHAIFIFYPLVPWVGIMAVGYAFGTLFNLAPSVRRPLFIKIGLACLTLFLVLRVFNIYGDPFPWHQQAIWWKNILAVIKVQKYPPSLLYVLMTLGIAILALALLEHTNNKLTRIFTVYGRVPFFYYLLHIYLIHSIQIVFVIVNGVSVNAILNSFGGPLPAGFGYGLPVIYLIWFSVVAVLYLPCRWFMGVKQRRKHWWLSYI